MEQFTATATQTFLGPCEQGKRRHRKVEYGMVALNCNGTKASLVGELPATMQGA